MNIVLMHLLIALSAIVSVGSLNAMDSFNNEPQELLFYDSEEDKYLSADFFPDFEGWYYNKYTEEFGEQLYDTKPSDEQDPINSKIVYPELIIHHDYTELLQRLIKIFGDEPKVKAFLNAFNADYTQALERSGSKNYPYDKDLSVYSYDSGDMPVFSNSLSFADYIYSDLADVIKTDGCMLKKSPDCVDDIDELEDCVTDDELSQFLSRATAQMLQELDDAKVLTKEQRLHNKKIMLEKRVTQKIALKQEHRELLVQYNTYKEKYEKAKLKYLQSFNVGIRQQRNPQIEEKLASYYNWLIQVEQSLQALDNDLRNEKSLKILQTRAKECDKAYAEEVMVRLRKEDEQRKAMGRPRSDSEWSL